MNASADIGSAASTFEGIVIEPGGPVVCMPAYVYPRKIEFSAYSGNTLVATRAEWFTRDAPNEFAFALPDAPARSADRIVIEICEYNDLVNPPERSSCSELTTVEPDEPASAPYCEYRFEVVTFGTGFLTNVGVTPLENSPSRIGEPLAGMSTSTQWQKFTRASVAGMVRPS
jgi:hypothetical protein